MKELIIKAKKRVFEIGAGNNLSVFKGDGIEFKELREYQYGEDAKRIDFKRSIKYQKPLVREFEDEKELHIIITILLSGSLIFGTVKTKMELILEIVALLAYASIKYQNKFSIILYDTKPTPLTLNEKKESSIPYILEKINSTPLLKKDYNQSVITYLNKFKKSILFLIGDFYHPINTKALKHETYTIIVRDKLEENPKPIKNLCLKNPINLKESFASFSKKKIKAYTDKIKTLDIKIFSQNPYHSTKIYTTDNAYLKLKELLK